jgi:hypothetical protein
VLIFVLPPKGDRGVLISHPHAQRRVARADGKLAVPELSGQIKRLARRLLSSKAQRILADLRLDAGTHRIGCPEEPIRRRQSFECLVRTLEVVVLDVQCHSALAVLEAREHGP